ncbi:MAG: hypothetical protein US31_C0008G0016 [Berkelbacteria bacterium GW2011_GWA1_36_9]|uniref:Polysaccharide pyruvyl transferase domain-containing protein n=1 Tax=Berkelbacteria bacterium GW2011_GWA1_36_9 TaxID=1618331 RepID=A0A0G0FGJ1_9BACT|nr:MAG: hypothetical protein US31_C0008G0016 [Berkelbacteria bacterium GW2011_GWA1_36_9]
MIFKKGEVVITGASTYGVKNHGDDAMLKVFCDQTRRIIPNSKITLVTRHPSKVLDQEFNIKSIKNIDHNSKTESNNRFFYGFNRGDQDKHLQAIKSEMEKSDLVVIGGNAFMEVSKSEFLRGVTTYSALFAIWAKLLGKPYVLYGAAVYPIKSDYTKKIAKFICENAALVTLREKDSLTELLKSGVKNYGNLKVFADPAWGLEPVLTKKRGQEILKKEGIKLKTKILIGIVFRHMYWLWNQKETGKYAKLIARLCDNLILKLNCDILLFPNCTYDIDNPYEDDRVIGMLITSKVKRQDKVHQIRGDLSLNNTLSIYPLLDFLISNRRHSLIFGAIHNVPIFALSTGHPWHFKPWIKELNLENQLASLTDDTISEIETRIIESFNRSDKIKKTISKTVPRLREKALRAIDEISKII